MKSRDEIKQIAVCMVKSDGLINLSRRGLCERAGIPDGSFPHIMGCNFTEFTDELLHEDIEQVSRVVSKTRVDPKLRRQQILDAAVEISKTEGYHRVTRDSIARTAGVSMGLVSRYFNTMPQLRRCIMRYAISNDIAEIVAQGLANSDEHAKKASPELKAKAATLLVNL